MNSAACIFLHCFLVCAAVAVSAVTTKEQTPERAEAGLVADTLSRVPLAFHGLDLSPEQKRVILGIERERALRYLAHGREMEKERATAERQMHALLTDAQKGELSRSVPAPATGLACRIATFPYPVPDAGTTELPSSTSWRIYTRYVGVDERGRRRVDERIGLVFRDRGHDAVVILLSPAAARRLSVALAATIAEREKE